MGEWVYSNKLVAIKLTHPSHDPRKHEKPVWVFVDHIMFLKEWDFGKKEVGSRVWLVNGDSLDVKESPERIGELLRSAE